MKITVSEIPDEGLEVDLEEEVPLQSLGIVAPVKAHLMLHRSGSDVLVTGDTRGEVELQCSRCLKGFALQVDSPLDLVYHPAETLGKDDHYELTRDELDAGFYRSDTLDTDDLLSEQLLLSLPMKPLCSPDCRGICPTCGADLGISECRCGTTGPESPFDALKDLLKRKE